MSHYTSPTVVLPRDPRTVEASQCLASFATHATVQAVAEWNQAHGVTSPTLTLTDDEVDTALAMLGGDL